MYSSIPKIPRHLFIHFLPLSRSLEGRSNGTELDVGEDDSGVRRVSLNILGLTRISRASTTSDTRRRGILISGERRVEPKHADAVIIPERHDEDVAASKRRTHLVETAELSIVVVVSEVSLLLLAELIGDGVSADLGVGGLGGGVGDAVLDVETLDLGKAGAGAEELGDDGEFLGRVDGHAGAVEIGVTHAVRL